MQDDVKSLLTKIGISTTIIGVAVLVGAGFIIYKNYYELQRTKLDILRLKRDLGLPLDNHLVKKK